MSLLRRHLLMLPAAVAVNSQTSDARTTTRGSTAAIYVDVTNPTGGKINPELYGASIHTGWGQGYDSFNLPSWCAATKSLNLRYLRLMGTNAMSTLFPAGATTISEQVRQNMAPLLHNFSSIGFTGTLNWTAGIIHDERNAVDYTTSAGQATLAQQMVSLARVLSEAGIKIDIWDIFNEPDFEGVDKATVASASAASFKALREFDPTCKIGGPTQAYGPYNYSDSFLAANPGADFVIYHHYDNHAPFHSNNTSPDLTLYTNALRHGDTVMPSVPCNGKPLLCNEYGINSAYTAPLWEPRHQQLPGALYTALLTLSGARAGLWGAAQWDLATNDQYGTMVDETGRIFPVAHFLSKAGETMPGAIVRVTVNAPGNTAAIATTRFGSYALMVVNYGVTAFSAAVSLTGAHRTSLNRWEQSRAYLSGRETTIAETDLHSQSFPAKSIVILHS